MSIYFFLYGLQQPDQTQHLSTFREAIGRIGQVQLNKPVISILTNA